MSNLYKKISDHKAYMEIIEPIINHPKIQLMSNFTHHGKTDCLTHSIHVSFMSYSLGLKLGLNEKALARAGLLHDFYLYDWHDKGDRKGLHGFTHAQTSMTNAKKYFTISNKEKDIIEKHMWPLNPKLPKFKESFLFMLVDRYCSVLESFHIPIIKGE
jgi:uncharacterized protein